MSVHRFHPAPGDPVGAILFDDCDRCAEQAAFLVGLDSANCRLLTERTVNVEIRGAEAWRTGTEAAAGRRIMRAVAVLARAAGLTPADYFMTPLGLGRVPE